MICESCGRLHGSDLSVRFYSIGHGMKCEYCHNLDDPAMVCCEGCGFEWSPDEMSDDELCTNCRRMYDRLFDNDYDDLPF